MQKNRNRGLRIRGKKIIPITKQACNKIPGFAELYQKIERFINVNARSKSTFTNYCRHLAHLALYFNQLPINLNTEQVLDYLNMIKLRGNASANFFKFTVYGLRIACKVYGLKYEQFSLPSIAHNTKLPAVLNASEVKQLFKACKSLKHRLLLGLCYGCGLRCGEVRNIRIADVDLERGMLHVRQGKGGKDRMIPLGNMLKRGIKKYIDTEKSQAFLFNDIKKYLETKQRTGYLFEGINGQAIASRSVQSIMSGALKKTTITKERVSLHTLRHSYATHLLEQGVNIIAIKQLLGHSHIETTMVYLHLTNPVFTQAVSPMDILYNQ
jgi:integrase/recombinase XerD